MRRVTVFERSGGYAGELDPSRVFGLTRKDAINGEHSLTIVTSIGLEKGQRVMLQDDRGYWREFVIYGADVTHDSAGAPIGTYYCVWSLQADLMGTRVDAMPGTQSPVSAATALDAVLENTSRWARGTVTNTNTGGASMYDTDGWDALSILIGTWGGEVDATIQADGFGITARKVDLYSQQGDQDAKRRFDFGEDLASVRRTIADGPLYCRVTPRGAGEQTDEGGYGRKITIESVNDGKDYLEDAGMVDIAKLPDGNGGWEYPTVEIENSECKEPADLKAWAQSVMEDYTRPKVTYAVDVLQIAREGIDMQGVSLGDAVQIVDRKLGGLRTTARVLEMTVDELSGKSVALTLGDMRDGLSSLFGTISAQLATVSDTVQVMNGGTFATADYLSNLLGRLNTQINGTGGYTYITEGDGIRCYDAAVSDPMVGAEASAAVEIKGGTIRIANTKTAQGEWEWKTVFTSGHIAADLVTAADLVAGSITSADGYSYWDLDSNVLRTRDMIAINMQASGTVTTESTQFKMIVASGSLQPYYRDSASDEWTSSGTMRSTSINGNRGLYFISPYLPETGSIRTRGEMIMTARQIWMYLRFLTGNTTVDNPGLFLNAGGSTFTDNSTATLKGAKVYITANQVISSRLSVDGAFSATGTKSRKTRTENYGDRLLYCYETPSPMFGDIGSGTIGEDGLCCVEIDDIFSETARTDYAYQVFLQKRGEGDLWVDEKERGYFTVRGTPNLAFDWELKARQTGYEYLRLEDEDLDGQDSFSFDMAIAALEIANTSPIDEIESMYEDELWQR